MDLIKKLVISIVFFAIAVVGLYYLLKSDRVFDVVLPRTLVGDEVRNSVDSARRTITGYADPYFTKAKSEVTEAADDAIQGVKDKTFEAVKDAVTKKIDDVGKNLGAQTTELISTAKNAVEGPLPVVFSVKKNEAAIFVIKNPEDIKGSVNYVIDWGDGKKDEGLVAEGATKSIFHIWTVAKEYALIINMKGGDVSRTYAVSIYVHD